MSQNTDPDFVKGKLYCVPAGGGRLGGAGGAG